MHRFFVVEKNLRGKQVFLTGRQAHQIRNVLRMKPGDHIIVLDNTGCEYTVVLTKVGRQDVVGEVISQRQAQAEPKMQITLYQSLLAREKFEWVLQKCTEVGVTKFVPMITERSIVRRPDAITSRKLSRWRDIIAEAAEQSGRGLIPQLNAPVNFADALCRLGDFDRCLIGTLAADGSNIREILQTRETKPVAVALFIGPEGGFTDGEIADTCSKGATAFSLGKRILRTETAAVVASAVILYELGELAP
jgi:16S rRNA (uracil1498-N3)-methyltransferase